MIFVTQKKFKLKKVKKRHELLKFCNVEKNSSQDTYKQRLSKFIKSDVQQIQRKIFQNKSVKVFSRNIKLFFKNNLSPFQILSTNYISKKIRLENFLKQQTIFILKSVLEFYRNDKRLFSKNPLGNKSETLKDFLKIIRLRFFLKRKTILEKKSVTISNFIGERFFLKNSLLKLHELSTDFILKKGLEVLNGPNFTYFETPINKGSQSTYFYKCLKKTIRFVFFDFFSSKIILTTNC